MQLELLKARLALDSSHHTKQGVQPMLLRRRTDVLGGRKAPVVEATLIRSIFDIWLSWVNTRPP